MMGLGGALYTHNPPRIRKKPLSDYASCVLKLLRREIPNQDVLTDVHCLDRISTEEDTPGPGRSLNRITIKFVVNKWVG